MSSTRPPRAAGLVRAVNDLKRLVEATERIIERARLRIGGVLRDGATRVVSLHDTQARPIAKGRLGKPCSDATRATWTVAHRPMVNMNQRQSPNGRS